MRRTSLQGRPTLASDWQGLRQSPGPATRHEPLIDVSYVCFMRWGCSRCLPASTAPMRRVAWHLHAHALFIHTVALGRQPRCLPLPTLTACRARQPQSAPALCSAKSLPRVRQPGRVVRAQLCAARLPAPSGGARGEGARSPPLARQLRCRASGWRRQCVVPPGACPCLPRSCSCSRSIRVGWAAARAGSEHAPSDRQRRVHPRHPSEPANGTTGRVSTRQARRAAPVRPLPCCAPRGRNPVRGTDPAPRPLHTEAPPRR